MSANSLPIWTVLTHLRARSSILRGLPHQWLVRSRSRVQLQDLDDRLLKDIGLTPCDQTFECNKWFWQA